MEGSSARRQEAREHVREIDHVLRSPLTMVVGYVELLLDGEFGPLTEEQAEVLRRVEVGARDLEQAVASLAVRW